MKTIILASASLRRKELLEQLGIKFKVEPGEFDEGSIRGTAPRDFAEKAALGKARTVAARHRNAIIIAADTIIVSGSRIIGKPHTENEARKILGRLSGRSHSVITGFSVIDTGNNKAFSASVETRVRLKKIPPEEIDAYVKSGEPLDKAGAYAIQGLGAVLVEKIVGDYYNVVGLPLSALADALKEFGVNILRLPFPRDSARRQASGKSIQRRKPAVKAAALPPAA
ncbi:MAG: nucleoside triphosphate pyrophosphatase [Dehalococcoidia bacterium]|nr:nucleoside triphosphate pyrophosphatase [Dehalococcoidia bacterium]